MNQNLIHQYALYLSHRYTRAVINTSFVILSFILILFGGKNPAAIFALVFYNGLYFFLLQNYRNKKKYRDISCTIPEALDDFLPTKIDTAELATNQIILPIIVLIHFIFAFGFTYRMTLDITYMNTFPLILLAFILITRYLSYLILKIYIVKNTKN